MNIFPLKNYLNKDNHESSFIASIYRIKELLTIKMILKYLDKQFNNGGHSKKGDLLNRISHH